INFFSTFPNVTFYLLEQPLPGCDFGDIVFRKYRGGKKCLETRKWVPFTPANNSKLSNNKTYMTLKLRDVFSNFMMTSRYQDGHVDLFIGLECINASFGALQKKRGRFKDSVYYIFDWAPDRYANPLINSAYLWLDKMASYYCDYTWNITHTIGDARIERLGYDKDRISPQLVVPYCYDYHPNNILPDDQIDPNLILYSGKHLHKLGLDGRYEITGFIADEAEVLKLQKSAGIAVAPYPIIKGSRKPYGDVIKIRMYFACGLPVVSTPVPPVTREIRQEKLGIVTDDDSPKALADAVSVYLADPEKLFATRKRVARKASKNNWHDNYTHALKKMGYSL
ncbi:MAG: glycosyltransferase, partial [Deltaproteobacteria bacterium]|nr:glycosyltransferase [Deltaproteobacteria bacterium]